MEGKRLPTPALGEPRLFGQPHHGLVVNGELTLSTGRKIEVTGVSGDCYIVRVPGTPPVDITPLESAREAASGREWRTYALLSGRDKHYGGMTIGADAWLYAAPDRTVWRIRCPQLDTTLVRAVPDPNFDFGWFPGTLDFEFHVERFGLIDGDAAPDSAVVVVAAQDLGGPIQSDTLRDPATGEKVPAELRRFPGDGYLTQWMPINIEDVSSSGDRCLFCCNRSREQSAANLPPQFGRAYPQSWLEVAVSGGGSADQIVIAMSVARQQSQAYPSVTSSLSYSTWPVWAQYFGGSFYWRDEETVISGSTRAILVQPRTAGAFYDANDVIQWAELSAEIRYVGSATHSAEMVGTSSSSAGGVGYVARHVDVTSTSSADVTVVLGGHPISVPQLRIESSSSRYYPELIDGADPPGYPPETFHVSVTVAGAFGTAVNTADDWGAFEGAFLVGASGSDIGVFDVDPSVVNGVCGRSVDNVRLVRMTNKTYAVMARWDLSWGPASEAQEMVIAVGGPDGWVLINERRLDYHASYNPGTGNLASSATDGLGWV